MTVALRPLAPGDEHAAVRWAADADFCAAAGWTAGLSPRVVTRHWRAIIAGSSPTFERWGVTLDGTLVGYVDLADITAQSAELGIAIGERARWGCGLGRRAGDLALARAWALGLAEVTALVHATNDRSLALMRSLGFAPDGWGIPEAYRGEVVPVRRYVIRRPD